MRIGKYKLTHYRKLLLIILILEIIINVGPLFMAKNLAHFLRALFVLLFVITFIKYKNNFLKFHKTCLYKDIIISTNLLLIWNVIIVLRGIFRDLSFREVFFALSQPTSCIAYIIPIFVFFKITEKSLTDFAKFSIISIICSMIFTIILAEKVFVSDLSLLLTYDEDLFYLYLGVSQLVSVSFIAIVFYWIRNNLKVKTRLFLWFAFFYGIISSLLLGRRSAALIPIIFLFLSFIYKLRSNKIYILILLLFISVSIKLYNTYESQLENFFPILFNRLTDDTRSEVEELFHKDMDFFSYIFGRGSTGLVDAGELGHRSMIETGYLNYILHGGVISLFLYIYILFMSALRGWFSKNKLAIAMSLYLFGQLAILYKSGNLSLQFSQLAIWICVAYCNNKQLRNSSFDIKV